MQANKHAIAITVRLLLNLLLCFEKIMMNLPLCSARILSKQRLYRCAS